MLISEARRLYVDEPLDLELEQTVYALDSTMIELFWSSFPGRSSNRQAAIKLHTLLDLRGNSPAYAWITTAKLHDTRILDSSAALAGMIYVLNRGYVDYARLFRLHPARATFVIRAKKNLVFRRLYCRPVDRPLA